MRIDDLPLDQTPAPPHRRPETTASPKRWVIVGALAITVAALLTLWWMSRTQPGTAIPAPTQATDVAVGSNRPKRQPISLPTLDRSDGFLSELISTLSRHPLVERLLATHGIVRNTVLAIEQIGDGRTPSVPLKVLRPTNRLAITGG